MALRRDLRAGKLALLVILMAALVIALFAGPGKVGAASSWPSSMASTGDSITRAYETGLFPFTDAPANSWATGTTSTVNSHYTRILANNPAIRGYNYNDAKTGARMIDLNGQMVKAVSQKAQYITVLMGANDVCSPAYSELTQAAADKFSADFDTALKTLVTGLPTTRVFVSSIPSLYQLWQINYSSASARTAWSVYKICQSMLANPNSFASADVARRTAVDQYTQNLNTMLQTVCARYTQCKYDDAVSYNYKFAKSDISTIDYFHPSLSGQRTLANVTWQKTFSFAS